MSSFAGSFGDESRVAEPTRPFDDDGYMGYDPRLASQQFEASFTNFDADSVKVSACDSPPFFTSQSYVSADEVFLSNPVPDTPLPPSFYSAGCGFSGFSPKQNGKSFDGAFGATDGSILPPPSEMPCEEGFALREWRRQNAIRLEEKEKKEKDVLEAIIEEAQQYKAEVYRKRALTLENEKASNREKEKLFLAGQEKFHAEAQKNYWTAIAELIPYEVPAIEKRGKQQAYQDKKKPSVVVIQGPKPGKPTDRSRMRQILGKLKHSPPPHMKPKTPPSSEPKKDVKTGRGAIVASVGASYIATTSKSAATAAPEAVAAA